MPVTIVANAKVFGDLKVGLTSEFEWRWNDKGTGSSRDGAFWHPRGVDEMRPLGSVIAPGYWDISNTWAALLVGPAHPEIWPPPVAPPWQYKEIFNYSTADASIILWQPIPPVGYVALGIVATQSGKWPSNDRNRPDIWCLREDLVAPGKFEERCTWDTWGGRLPPMSFWHVHPRFDGISLSDGQFPILAGTFWINNGGWDQPDIENARVPLLKATPVSTPRVLPDLTLDEIPTQLDRWGVPPSPFVKAEMLCAQTYVPLTAFFAAGDRRVLDRVRDPFFSIRLYRTWTAEKFTHVGPSGGNAAFDTKRPPSGGRSDSPLTIDATNGLKLHSSGASFNSPLGIDLERDVVGRGSLNMPPNSVVVLWKQDFRTEVRLGGDDGPVVDTGIPSWYSRCYTVLKK